MSVVADDFVAIAQWILNEQQSEISHRSSANRAYYGAFHACLSIAENHPKVFLDPALPTHARLYRAVGSLSGATPDESDLKKIIYLTKNLRDVRVHADYDLTRPFLNLFAIQAISTANNVLNLRRQYKNKYGY